MANKPLYIFISNSGDGSYCLRYTLDGELVEALQRAYDDDKMTWDNGIGMDGDGFHYDTVLVPEDATPESLGLVNRMMEPRHFSALLAEG